jgi:hypothetical protein
MSEPRKYTREEIKAITFEIESLDHDQREKVREHLLRYHDQKGGTFYEESFTQELRKMRAAGTISEIDYHAVKDAFFG